ncbi:hypothetical protein GGTG_14450 [Gaeumannomyces tritici R3-111a-1]|uniref:Uncharacterized protein n=1 Tax=Gaeumannomyces tritici (strain R3-111a-1) TaxID=644352 RepID=J3PLH4_GAET3|nr:hypothetical protein GGTG_14450 [Gaeumannomyces tritici R3-111a-1]EJT67973.1 hypothetical protein GGTG_14450 [Gaeumannomyces tritici R3-111a-1]
MVLNMTASLAVAINLLPPGSPLFPDEKIEVCTEDGMFALVKEFPSHFETVQHRLLPLQATPETHRETQPAQRTQRSAKSTHPELGHPLSWATPQNLLVSGTR